MAPSAAKIMPNVRLVKDDKIYCVKSISWGQMQTEEGWFFLWDKGKQIPLVGISIDES